MEWSIDLIPACDIDQKRLRLQPPTSGGIIDVIRIERRVIELIVEGKSLVMNGGQQASGHVDGMEKIRKADADMSSGTARGHVSIDAREPRYGRELELPLAVGVAIGRTRRRRPRQEQPGQYRCALLHVRSPFAQPARWLGGITARRPRATTGPWAHGTNRHWRRRSVRRSRWILIERLFDRVCEII